MSHDEKLSTHLSAACYEWQRLRQNWPAWMLPVVEDLPELEAYFDSRRLDFKYFVTRYRARQQPIWTFGNVVFPDSGTPRKDGSFDLARLTTAELQTYDDWFSSHGRWQTNAQQLASLTNRPLSQAGLVWRQHDNDLIPNGVDIINAIPDTVVQLPYPVACRSKPNPIGSLLRPLAGREKIKARQPYSNLYLEIWAHTGIAFPSRPKTGQFESEVLLPQGSRFRVIRHVDFPYCEEGSSKIYYTHGVQLLQL